MPWVEFEDWRHRSMITEEQAYRLLGRVTAMTTIMEKISVEGLAPIEARHLRDKMNEAQRHVASLVNRSVSLCYSIHDFSTAQAV